MIKTSPASRLAIVGLGLVSLGAVSLGATVPASAPTLTQTVTNISVISLTDPADGGHDATTGIASFNGSVTASEILTDTLTGDNSLLPAPAIAEPDTIALLGTGLFALCRVRRRAPRV